ncbi:DUF167 domain-containing protein [bacterium]|nr:MAG: DUF167 domain-containing protein [bacterium]
MKIIVIAKTAAREDKIESITQPALRLSDYKPQTPVYKVWVKALPVHGKSNVAISKLLANHFKVNASRVRLVAGRASKQKLFDIDIDS